MAEIKSVLDKSGEQDERAFSKISTPSRRYEDETPKPKNFDWTCVLFLGPAIKKIYEIISFLLGDQLEFMGFN